MHIKRAALASLSVERGYKLAPRPEGMVAGAAVNQRVASYVFRDAKINGTAVLAQKLFVEIPHPVDVAHGDLPSRRATIAATNTWYLSSASGH